MPVRSLNSSVLKWPDRLTVEQALRAWASVLAQRCADVLRIGYTGSYARGDWGVGSDLDVVVVLEKSEQPFHRRSTGFDTSGLPVPTDLLVYTRSEWEALQGLQTRFAQETLRDIVWVFRRD